MQSALSHLIPSVILAFFVMMTIGFMQSCGSPLSSSSRPAVVSSSSLVEPFPAQPSEHWLMNLDHPSSVELLIASTLIPAMPTMPTSWLPALTSVGWSHPLVGKLNHLVLKHPVSRTLIIGGVAIVAALTATRAYVVAINAAEEHYDHINLDNPLIPSSRRDGVKPRSHHNKPPPPSELMIPIPRFSQDYAIDDPPSLSSLVHIPSSSPPKSLFEQQQILEQKVISNQKQQKIIDRIHQLNLQLYAQKRGITVDRIPQDERLRLESEQNFKHITEHINEFSDENMERLMSRIDELENAMTKLKTTHNNVKSERTIIGQLKQKHLNLIWQAISAGVLFVLFL